MRRQNPLPRVISSSNIPRQPRPIRKRNRWLLRALIVALLLPLMTSGLAQGQSEISERCAYRMSADGELPLYRPNPPAIVSFADQEPAYGPVSYVDSGSVYIRFYLEFPIEACDIGIDGWLMDIKKSDSGMDFSEAIWDEAKWDFNPDYDTNPIPILHSALDYDSSYDISVRYENEHGLSDPLIVTVRTGSADGSGFDNDKRIFSNPVDESSWKRFQTYWTIHETEGRVHTFSTLHKPVGILVGSRIRVSAGNGVNLRECPGTGCAKIMLLARDTEAWVLEGPVEAGNYEWYRILAEDAENGGRIEGWMAHSSSSGTTFAEELKLDIKLANSLVNSLDILDDINVETEEALYEDREFCFPDDEGQFFLGYFDSFQNTESNNLAPLQKYLSPDGGACFSLKGLSGAELVYRVADNDVAHKLRELIVDDFRHFLLKGAKEVLPPTYGLGVIHQFMADEVEKRLEEAPKAREDLLNSLARSGLSAEFVKVLLATYDQALATFDVPMQPIDNEHVDAVVEQVRTEEEEREQRQQE